MSNIPSHQGVVCNVCALALPPTLHAPVPAARSDRLDLTLSSHLMSDGSGSRCRMMSESPRKFNIFTAHIVANVSVGPFVSTTVDVPYQNVLTYMLSTFSPPVAATSFNMRESHCITGSSLSSMMPSVRLCGSACALLLTHDVE